MTLSIQTISLSAVIPDDLQGFRLDQALARLFPDYSRSRLQTWIAAGQVQVDTQRLRGKDKVTAGQHIVIDATVEAASNWQAQVMPLQVIYADAALIIVAKPAGLVVHPACGNPDNTLVNALLHFDPELARLPRAGIIHRLDKDTSGLLVVARNLAAHHHLTAQMQARTIKREYIALVNGTLISGGSVREPIGRHPTKRTHMAVLASGRSAVTHYRINERFSAHTCVDVTLETGRTHQIRVHMSHIGYPLLGDQTYGGRFKIPRQCSDDLKNCLQAFKRQALHARKLTLQHPETNEQMSWEANIPDDLNTLLARLREHKIALEGTH